MTSNDNEDRHQQEDTTDSTTSLQNHLRTQNAELPIDFRKNRISRGVENRGSLISVPLALRVFFSFVLIELKPFVLKGKVLGEKV